MKPAKRDIFLAGTEWSAGEFNRCSTNSIEEDCVRKRIAIAVMGLLLVGGTAGSALAQGGGSANGNNAHGMCTAAANGQKTGWLKKGSVPPSFQNFHDNYLELKAELNGELENGQAEATRQDIIDDCNLAGIAIGGQQHR